MFLSAMAKVNMKPLEISDSIEAKSNETESAEGGIGPLLALKLLPSAKSAAKSLLPSAKSAAKIATKSFAPAAKQLAAQAQQHATSSARRFAAPHATAARQFASQAQRSMQPMQQFATRAQQYATPRPQTPIPIPLPMQRPPMQQYAPRPPYARGALQTEFKGVPLHAIGGADTASTTQQEKAPAVSATPEQYEEMKTQADKDIESAKDKAEYEHAKTVDSAKIEPESIAAPVVSTAILPVVVGAANGGAFSNILMVMGILLLIYALYVLYQPSLTGKWIINNDSSKYVIIEHNRFTGGLILTNYFPDVHAAKSAKPNFAGVAVGLRKKLMMPKSGYVSGSSIILKENDMCINFGVWDHKNTINAPAKSLSRFSDEISERRISPGGVVYSRV